MNDSIFGSFYLYYKFELYFGRRSRFGVRGVIFRLVWRTFLYNFLWTENRKINNIMITNLFSIYLDDSSTIAFLTGVATDTSGLLNYFFTI